MEKIIINKYVKILVAALFSCYLPVVNALNINQIKESAEKKFSLKEYTQAMKLCNEVIHSAQSSNFTKAECLKITGLIHFYRGNNSGALNDLNKAKRMGLVDRLIDETLKKISINFQIEKNYIVQVGYFKSSINANNIIKKVTPILGEFSLVKEKENDSYIVYFDGFENKDAADQAAINLKALNNDLSFIVKGR